MYKKFVDMIFYKALVWESHQIYNLGAVGDSDELARFWGQKVKGQGHDDNKCGQKSTWDILKVMRSNIQITDNLSGKDMLVDGSLLWVVYLPVPSDLFYSYANGVI